jgi:uncharacterized membrane protein YidH (DUF202 family)
MSRDPGLQPERTALAWNRTALGSAVVGACLLRCGVRCGLPLEVAAGLCAAAVAVLAGVAVRVPRNAAVSRNVLCCLAAGIVLAGLLMAAQLIVTLGSSSS